MAVAAILAAAPIVTSTIGTVGGWLGFGGADPGASGVCPNQYAATRVATVLARMNATERAEWMRLYNLSNARTPYSGNPATIAFQLAGGSDCRVSSSTGLQWTAYHRTMDAKYATGAYEADATPTAAAQVAAQQADAGVGAQVSQILGSIYTAGKEIVTSTVTGAISGAQASTQGAAAGATAGNIATRNALPLLGIAAVGALAVVLMLAFRRR